MYTPAHLGHVVGAAVLSSVLTAGLTLGLHALADQNPATDNVVRQINYEGVLELDGQPVNMAGSEGLWMRFTMYDGPTLDTEVYQQDINVNVYQGRFSTPIGPTADDGSALEEVVRAADDLYLSITLLNDPADEGDDVVLSNAQRLSITPYAVWASHSTRFNVANRLLVSTTNDTTGDFVRALPNGDLRATGEGRMRTLTVDEGA
ncbi:MAG: hypothetical protein AAFX99_19270, partial [Myxococcota bacterium]